MPKHRVEKDVAVEDPASQPAARRGPVHQRPVVEPDPERQRVLPGTSMLSRNSAVREHVARAADPAGPALGQAERLNRETVQVERVMRAGRVGDRQLAACRRAWRSASSRAGAALLYGSPGSCAPCDAVDPEAAVTGDVRRAGCPDSPSPAWPARTRVGSSRVSVAAPRTSTGSPVAARSGVPSAIVNAVPAARHLEVGHRHRGRYWKAAARAQEVLGPQREHAAGSAGNRDDDVGAIAGIEQDFTGVVLEVEAAAVDAALDARGVEQSALTANTDQRDHAFRRCQ